MLIFITNLRLKNGCQDYKNRRKNGISFLLKNFYSFKIFREFRMRKTFLLSLLTNHISFNTYFFLCILTEKRENQKLFLHVCVEFILVFQLNIDGIYSVNMKSNIIEIQFQDFRMKKNSNMNRSVDEGEKWRKLKGQTKIPTP